MTTLDTSTSSTTRRSGWHPVNVGHFVMGIAFVGIVVVWILISSDAVSGDDVRWLLPVPWVLAGIAGLLATTRRHRDTDEWRDAAYGASHTGWVGDAPAARFEEPQPLYDDLDEKLARAERESADQQDPTDPTPTDPIPTDPEENPR